MPEDPVVAEVHRIREKLAAKFNFDVAAIFADIRKRQESLGERLVPQKTRTEPKGRDSGSRESTSSDAAPAA